MPPTQGVTGYGTLLEVGNGVEGNSTAYSAVGECRTITGPGLSMEMVDFTHQQSDSSYRERKPTFKNAGDFTIDLTFLPEDSAQGYQTGLLGDFETQVLRDFRITYPNAEQTIAKFSAYIGGFQVTAPIDDRLSAQLTLSTSGPVEWSNAASFTT
jgi:hypothetical protein